MIFIWRLTCIVRFGTYNWWEKRNFSSSIWFLCLVYCPECINSWKICNTCSILRMHNYIFAWDQNPKVYKNYFPWRCIKMTQAVKPKLSPFVVYLKLHWEKIICCFLKTKQKRVGNLWFNLWKSSKTSAHNLKHYWCKKKFCRAECAWHLLLSYTSFSQRNGIYS